uniref:Uncharacterized protein n=1 Tax=uncultured prokaryote TaxID=198431 RepID=A0A0H5Q5V0_9ZZZZ|nr:hypothetical protein [uncultured prokaryote]
MALIGRVETEFTGLGGAPWLSTLHFAVGEDTPGNNPVAVMNNFWGDLAGIIAAAVSWTTLGEVRIIDVETGDTVDYLTTAPQTGNGTDTGNVLPIVSQGLIRWNTPVVTAGRRLRGHTFVPGLTENSCTASGSVTPTSQATFIDAADTAISTSATLNCALEVYSRTHNTATSDVSPSAANKFSYLSSRRD